MTRVELNSSPSCKSRWLRAPATNLGESSQLPPGTFLNKSSPCNHRHLYSIAFGSNVILHSDIGTQIGSEAIDVVRKRGCYRVVGCSGAWPPPVLSADLLACTQPLWQASLELILGDFAIAVRIYVLKIYQAP